MTFFDILRLFSFDVHIDVVDIVVSITVPGHASLFLVDVDTLITPDLGNGGI